MNDVNIVCGKLETLKPLLSKIVRPQALSDLTLPKPTIQRLQRVIESGSWVNMMFYGPPGSGKTSAAKIVMNGIGRKMTINCLSKTSPDLAQSIKEFFGYRDEICFVDQAHLLSKRDQAVLPDIIDWASSRKFRLLFGATDITKLMPAIRSRLTEISFDVPPEDREEVKRRLMQRYEKVLSAPRFTFDKVRLEQIIEANFPDLRAIGNKIEFEFG